MKTLLSMLLVVAVAMAGWSQTNLTAQMNATVQTNAMAQTKATPQNAAHQEFGLSSDHFTFYGNTRQIVYYDHVVVTNAQLRGACERLTLNFPSQASGDRPTNAVAETNLDIIYVNIKGETNYLNADKGIYEYSVIKGVTNETCTFTGHVTNRTDKYWMTGEPLIYDVASGNISGDKIEMHGKLPAGNGTNASPFNFEK